MLDFRSSPKDDTPQGQAAFDMANLRPRTTGLPFTVFISQKAGARHDVRVKVSRGPKVLSSQMSSYALRPFRLVEGVPLSGAEEQQLKLWVERNEKVIVEYWDGEIEYTEDAIDRIVPV